VSVREIARKLNRAPSSVSQAIASLRDAALVDRYGKPAVPDLFWDLADRWHPASRDVEIYPSPTVTGVAGSINDALRLGLKDEEIERRTGWALTDTVAAAAYGAAITVRSDHPPDLYVPDQTIMRRALKLLGATSNHDTRAATIRLAPFPLVCARRIDMATQTWPLARPLFVALDLAQDLDRGRAILEGWTPPPGAGQRVW
jgi:DNA-binding transcriptional ArsR family regulator